MPQHKRFHVALQSMTSGRRYYCGMDACSIPEAVSVARDFVRTRESSGTRILEAIATGPATREGFAASIECNA